MEGRPAAALTEAPEEVLALLPAGWRLDGGRALDLDETIESSEAPPLSLPNASVRLTWSRSGFTAMADAWAEWIVEVGRLLADDGVAVVGLAERQRFERLTGEAWDDSRIGMTVLDAMNEAPHTLVFHSEWWLQSHWGRAFGRIEMVERDGLRHALLSRPVAGITAEQLERPAEGDKRELAAASANASYLRSQVDLLAKRHRHQLADQREEMGRELMRRSFAAADLEWARRGPGSPATLAAAEYEATTSWRLTRPLRALGAMVRRLR
jgi:hypothetical protein